MSQSITGDMLVPFRVKRKPWVKYSTVADVRKRDPKLYDWIFARDILIYKIFEYNTNYSDSEEEFELGSDSESEFELDYESDDESDDESEEPDSKEIIQQLEERIQELEEENERLTRKNRNLKRKNNDLEQDNNRFKRKRRGN